MVTALILLISILLGFFYNFTRKIGVILCTFHVVNKTFLAYEACNKWSVNNNALTYQLNCLNF